MSFFIFLLRKQTDKPEFLPQVKSPEADGKGFEMYYTDQCPFNARAVPVLRQTAEAKGIPAECVHIQSVEAAKKHACGCYNLCSFMTDSI